jgi:hypothetical protein
LALIWLASGGRSVGVIRLKIKATEFVCLFVVSWWLTKDSKEHIPSIFMIEE